MSIILNIFNRDFITLFLQNWLGLAISHAFITGICLLITKDFKQIFIDITLMCFVFFFFWAILTTPLFYLMFIKG